MKIKKSVISALFLLYFISLTAAADFNILISNSEKWTDVYSVVHYSNLIGVDGKFLTSTSHGQLILNEISKANTIKVMSSTDKPYMFGYQGLIESNGYETREELESSNLNLELIKDSELANIKNFIVVGDSYGYNALAIAPYAKLTNAWVFFANRANIFEIDAILSGKQIDNLIVYGFVDRQVTDTLSKYNPEVITTKSICTRF